MKANVIIEQTVEVEVIPAEQGDGEGQQQDTGEGNGVDQKLWAHG